MDIEFKFRGINMNERQKVRVLFLEQVAELKGRLPITSVKVFLEKEPDMTPAYWLWTNLIVPGPDIYAFARDHTPLAAWLKVSKELKREIQRRKLRQVAKRKSNLKLRGSRGRQSGTSSNRGA